MLVIAMENDLMMPVTVKIAMRVMRLSRSMKSLENLVRILPEGLESKNRTLALSTLSEIFLLRIVWDESRTLLLKSPRNTLVIRKMMMDTPIAMG